MKQDVKWNAKQITLVALAMAVVCIATMVIQIPIPLGYMHLGNCCILLISVFLDTVTGTLASGIGSAMADLLSGYPQWIIPTLIIKGLMGYTVARISKKDKKRAGIISIRMFLATASGILIMIMGYTLFGMLLYGSVASGLAQIPGLSLEGVLGMVLFYMIGFVLEKSKIIHLQQW
ncbi:MAG: ECF transporter S component [Cellulosilyticum sp.]|nr:ECF transporter S component [Cellulosilyticum sp.]